MAIAEVISTDSQMIICAQFVVCREGEDSVGSIESKPRLKLDSLDISSLIGTVALLLGSQGLKASWRLKTSTPKPQIPKSA